MEEFFKIIGGQMAGDLIMDQRGHGRLLQQQFINFNLASQDNDMTSPEKFAGLTASSHVPNANPYRPATATA